MRPVETFVIEHGALVVAECIPATTLDGQFVDGHIFVTLGPLSFYVDYGTALELASEIVEAMPSNTTIELEESLRRAVGKKQAALRPRLVLVVPSTGRPDQV